MKRVYFDVTAEGVYWPNTWPCEHCDGERSNLVRHDFLRGNVCPPCDSSLDEMFEEDANTPYPRTLEDLEEGGLL